MEFISCTLHPMTFHGVPWYSIPSIQSYKLRLPVAKFTFIKMTWYPNDKYIRFGTLLKEGLLRSPSFTKVLHPIFLIIGTWMQAGERSKPDCIQVLHSIFFITLVLWCSQVHFAHLPAPKYCILLFKFSILSIVLLHMLQGGQVSGQLWSAFLSAESS